MTAPLRELLRRIVAANGDDPIIDFQKEAAAVLEAPRAPEDGIKEALRFINEVPIDDYANRWIYQWRDRVAAQLENLLSATPPEPPAPQWLCQLGAGYCNHPQCEPNPKRRA